MCVHPDRVSAERGHRCLQREHLFGQIHIVSSAHIANQRLIDYPHSVLCGQPSFGLMISLLFIVSVDTTMSIPVITTFDVQQFVIIDKDQNGVAIIDIEAAE